MESTPTQREQVLHLLRTKDLTGSGYAYLRHSHFVGYAETLVNRLDGDSIEREVVPYLTKLPDLS